MISVFDNAKYEDAVIEHPKHQSSSAIQMLIHAYMPSWLISADLIFCQLPDFSNRNLIRTCDQREKYGEDQCAHEASDLLAATTGASRIHCMGRRGSRVSAAPVRCGHGCGRSDNDNAGSRAGDRMFFAGLASGKNANQRKQYYAHGCSPDIECSESRGDRV